MIYLHYTTLHRGVNPILQNNSIIFGVMPQCRDWPPGSAWMGLVLITSISPIRAALLASAVEIVGDQCQIEDVIAVVVLIDNCEGEPISPALAKCATANAL